MTNLPSTQGRSRTERRSRLEIGLALACVCFFCFHWSAIIVRVSGHNPVSRSLGWIVAYPGALFPQGWRLFAPDPGKFSSRLLYRCKAEGGDWSDWRSTVADLLRVHYAMRITHHGKLLRIPIELMKHVEKQIILIEQKIPCDEHDTPCLLRQGETLKRSPIYLETQRFVKTKCEAGLQESNQRVTAAQFGFERAYPRPYEQRGDSSVRPKTRRFEFDPFSVTDPRSDVNGAGENGALDEASR